MRKNPTEAEDVLWKYLRNDELGVRFRRQYPLGGRILDFYAPTLRLGIEVDGEIHRTRVAQADDALRSEYLADEYDVFILRFSNEEILQDTDNVLLKISEHIQKQKHPLPPVEEGLGMEGLKILDLGTGGGFPLLPLAILFPEHRFIGLDSVRKKMDAVGRIVSTLELANVNLVTGRAEETGRDPAHREHYDVITVRAVAETAILLEYCAPFVKQGGHILLWKSMEIDEEISASSGAESKLFLKRKSPMIYDLDADWPASRLVHHSFSDGGSPRGAGWGKRQILVYEKTKVTLQEYPRPVGSAKKHPL